MIARRTALGLLAAATGAALARPVAAGTADPLIDEARRLAAGPWRGATMPLPPPFDGLTYDAYRGIRPKPGAAALLPLGEGWAVDLLPPGLYFPDAVTVELPEAGGFAPRPFSPRLFDFSPRYFDAVPGEAPGAGFSGLRLRYPLNAPDVLDEVLVVQGGSYFRAIGRAMAYGLSARAVARGTGGPVPEEFPRFIRLRLHPPAGGSARLEAVIDGPSLAGHMDMTLTPGGATRMSLTVTLMPRVEIADIGVAPLTSMFLKGPIRAAASDDFRPRVHDSDALVIENGAGEVLWRPISNPAALQTSAFADAGPRAFGLWQGPRDFADYEDAEARYHRRPSAMVRPRGDWGPGAVTLVEIPTGDEFMDNIVAFWRPDSPLAAGSEHAFAYDIEWTDAAPPLGPLRPILQSRSGREHHRPGHRRYVIDVAGPPDGLVPDLSALGDGAELSGLSVHALPERGATRVTFLLAPGGASAVELRLVLRDGAGRPASPVWLHRWTPARDRGV
ncbi:glucan biosynthesis protein [Rhodovulum sp. 12E13]|uniref:glucan biosynthesis protein n=1 Tax=Rhodovulum sp. 12E13 TaxID=2203891 RepID=UPI001F37FF24|nr:glucan biosynthesis protein [Rhodovulum sp. 12E13]